MLLTFALGLVSALLLFAALWAVCVRLRNYSFVDVAWSCAIGALALIYAVLGTGHLPRRVIFTAIAVAWSLRLGTHILLRVLREHPHEDSRYRSLREQWKSPLQFLLFFEIQAITAAVLSLPFLFTAFDSRPSFAPIELVGYSLAILALVGEATADRQMKTFASDPSNRGQVCNVGLWRYSRHPNYFFESVVWWGFFLAALATPWGWTTLICPLLMLWFLLKVTGIPLTEKHSVEKRGDAYRQYQRTTSAFIPWFPKRHP